MFSVQTRNFVRSVWQAVVRLLAVVAATSPPVLAFLGTSRPFAAPRPLTACVRTCLGQGVRGERPAYDEGEMVSFVQSINPVMIIILSGVFAALWTKLGRR